MRGSQHTIDKLAAYHKRYVLLLLVCLSPVYLSAQEFIWKADRQRILIGQPFTCRLSLPLPSEDAVFQLILPDSIAHFELIKAPTDSAQDGKPFAREWSFTSYDSGSWVLPAFPVKVSQGGQDKTLYTDSLIVDVMYDPADSTGIPRDIKPVIDLPVKDYTLYFILGGALLILILFWLLTRYLRNKKRGSGMQETSHLSPIDELKVALDTLQRQPLDTRMDHVAWHSALSAAFRKYMERKTGHGILSSTTGDLLIRLGREGVEKEEVSLAAEVLRTGDAVKFARYEPSAESTRDCIGKIRTVAERMEKVKS